MAINDQTPSKTDTNFFTDGDDLTDFLQDQRLADTTVTLSFDDAQAIVAAFAESSGDGAWIKLDRATVAARLATLIQPSAAGDAAPAIAASIRRSSTCVARRPC